MGCRSGFVLGSALLGRFLHSAAGNGEREELVGARTASFPLHPLWSQNSKVIRLECSVGERLGLNLHLLPQG